MLKHYCMTEIIVWFYTKALGGTFPRCPIRPADLNIVGEWVKTGVEGTNKKGGLKPPQGLSGSIWDIMLNLAWQFEVPAEHVSNGRTGSQYNGAGSLHAVGSRPCHNVIFGQALAAM